MLSLHDPSSVRSLELDHYFITCGRNATQNVRVAKYNWELKVPWILGENALRLQAFKIDVKVKFITDLCRWYLKLSITDVWSVSYLRILLLTLVYRLQFSFDVDFSLSTFKYSWTLTNGVFLKRFVTFHVNQEMSLRFLRYSYAFWLW